MRVVVVEVPPPLGIVTSYGFADVLGGGNKSMPLCKFRNGWMCHGLDHIVTALRRVLLHKGQQPLTLPDIFARQELNLQRRNVSPIARGRKDN